MFPESTMTKLKSAVLILLVGLIMPTNTLGQIQVVNGIDYRPDEEIAKGRDLLDIYMPSGASRVPVIVYFHGGALMNGDRVDNEAIGTRIASLGIGFVGPTYRMSPDVSHPQHAVDAATAFKWVVDNIDSFGGDPENLYIAGHSAGAYLAALIAYDAEYLESVNVPPASIKGAILLSPFLYVEETAPVRIEWGVGAETIWGSDPEGWLDASISQLVAPSQVRTILIYADGDDDWRKGQIKRLRDEMNNAGRNEIDMIEVSDRTHGSLNSSALKEDDVVGPIFIQFIQAK